MSIQRLLETVWEDFRGIFVVVAMEASGSAMELSGTRCCTTR